MEGWLWPVKVVDDELAKVRAMSVADIYSLPEHSTREIETTWKSRRSVSVYAEKCNSEELRVIVKAFESRFPHASTQARAGGFRVSRPCNTPTTRMNARFPA